MKPTWYQRWFGYTSEYQKLSWKLIGLVAALFVIYVLLPVVLVGLIVYACVRS